jgi:membrane protease YdiL (CAAX protease family)
VLIPLSAVLNNKHLTNTASNSHVPAYYVIYGLTLAATTAINEEVLVNGYFLTRLSQLGWSPRRALGLSLAVRTSYHLYYGVGLIVTVPFGYLVTRSFQKRRRLLRPILAHFLYDAILITVAVLTS